MVEKDNVIQWVECKKERRTKDCHAITYGVKCSRCGCFQDMPSRYCKDCGGYYNGVLPEKFDKRRFTTWQV